MKKRILGAFAGFLAVMLLFTVLSRAADSVTIARVTVQRVHEGRISHRVSGSGKVEQNREQAVSTLAGQIVKTIYVEEGQQVAAGDLLFDVDLESLQEQILEKKQELKISDLEAKDRATNLEAQAQKEAISQNRAAEDYNVAVGKGNTAVSRAAQALNEARKKLAALNKSSSGQPSGEDAVQAVLEETCEEKKLAYDSAVEYKEWLEEEIERAVEKALAGSGVLSGQAASSRLVALERRVHTAAMEEDESLQTELQAVMETTAPELEPDTDMEMILNAEPPATEAPLADMGTPESQVDMEISEPQAETTVEMETLEPQTEPPIPDEGTLDILPAPETEPVNTEPQSEWTTDAELILGDEEESWQSTEDPWLLEQRIRLENQPLLDDAEEQIRLAEQEMKEADAALQSYLQEKAAGSAQTGVEEMKAQIQEEIRAKQQAYEDAVTAANDGLRAAGRAVEDASAPKGTDSTVEIDEITREQKELQLDKLERLKEAGGKVTSPIDGVVERINLTTGDRTPDGTAVLLLDKASGSKLVVQIPREQEEYIARGDDVKVRGRNKEEITGLKVDSVRTNEGDQELLDVTVQLPSDALETGVSASIECEQISELYKCCVPLQSLYEENGKYFLYVLTESNSILGTELTVQRLNVTVLEKNETDAALQTGTIGMDKQVVVATDKILSNGSRVRIAE